MNRPNNLTEQTFYQNTLGIPVRRSINLNIQIKRLTQPRKDLYTLFNICQLELSRLYILNNFTLLTQQLKQFNTQLQKWKLSTLQNNITNLVLTYHLYANLFSRLKYVSNFIQMKQDAVKALEGISLWFFHKKAQIRNSMQDRQSAVLQTGKITNEKKVEEQQIEYYVQQKAVSRQMQPYRVMARTAHSSFHPPKDELNEYKRKKTVQIDDLRNKNKIQIKKKSKSIPKFNTDKKQHKNYNKDNDINSNKYGITRTTFKETATTFKTNQKPKSLFRIVQPIQILKQHDRQDLINKQEQNKNRIIINQETLLPSQQPIQQIQLMNEIIKQPHYAEDQPDNYGEQLQSQQQQQQRQNKQIKKIYQYDVEQINIQENMKQYQQSTLRKIIKKNNQKIYSKLEELNIKNNMINWGKLKGKNHTNQNMKLQKYLRTNQNKKIQYHKFAIKTHRIMSHNNNNNNDNNNNNNNNNDLQLKTNQIKFIQRSKSSHIIPLQQQLQKYKINTVMKKYNRYLNHINLQNNNNNKETNQLKQQQIQSEINQQDNIQNYRMSTTSLTNLSSRNSRKQQYFSDLINNNGNQQYNECQLKTTLAVKELFANKMININKGTVHQALIRNKQYQTKNIKQIHPYKNNLLSNPFFPKHLYQNKPQLKKK